MKKRRERKKDKEREREKKTDEEGEREKETKRKRGRETIAKVQMLNEWSKVKPRLREEKNEFFQKLIPTLIQRERPGKSY
jgi:hypothetical protein